VQIQEWRGRSGVCGESWSVVDKQSSSDQVWSCQVKQSVSGDWAVDQSTRTDHHRPDPVRWHRRECTVIYLWHDIQYLYYRLTDRSTCPHLTLPLSPSSAVSHWYSLYRPVERRGLSFHQSAAVNKSNNNNNNTWQYRCRLTSYNYWCSVYEPMTVMQLS